MDSNPHPLTREELDKIQARIVELTAKIKVINDQQDEAYGQDRRLTPEEMKWNKELRTLKRQRDNNEN